MTSVRGTRTVSGNGELYAAISGGRGGICCTAFEELPIHKGVDEAAVLILKDANIPAWTFVYGIAKRSLDAAALGAKFNYVGGALISPPVASQNYIGPFEIGMLYGV